MTEWQVKISQKYRELTGNPYIYLDKFHPDIKFVHFTHSINKRFLNGKIMIKPEDNTFPILAVQTTYKCNMLCANCYLGDMLNNPKFADVDPTKLEEVFKKLPKRTDIRFIGAEPTMNDGLFEMIKLTKRYKHRPQILTNGLKLGQEQYVIDLKKSGLNWLGLSMNGGLDDEVYKRFDNGKYAKLKKRALEYCIKHKIVPHINIIVDPTNLHY